MFAEDPDSAEATDARRDMALAEILNAQHLYEQGEISKSEFRSTKKTVEDLLRRAEGR